MSMAATQTKPKLNLPLKTRLLVGLFKYVGKAWIKSDGTVNRSLLSILERKVSAPSTRLINNINVNSTDVSVDPSRHLWFRLFVPSLNRKDSSNNDGAFPQKLPLIVFFHGGGFVQFGPNSKTFDDLCSAMAAEVPATVASVNYRLAPENRYPCAYDDGFDALKFIDEQNHAILPPNTDLSRCFLAGDSAGGNIAHHVAVRLGQNPQLFEKLKVVGFLALQPFFGGEERTDSEKRLADAPVLTVKQTDWMWRSYLPEGADRDHEAANVFGGGKKAKDPDLGGVDYPKTLLFVGGFDPLQDWQRRYCEGLKRCGKEVELVEYPNAFHGFYAFPELPESSLCLQRIKEFVCRQDRAESEL